MERWMVYIIDFTHGEMFSRLHENNLFMYARYVEIYADTLLAITNISGADRGLFFQ